MSTNMNINVSTFRMNSERKMVQLDRVTRL